MVVYVTSHLITDQDKDSGDGSVNVTVQDDGQTWDDIKVCQFNPETCYFVLVL